MRTKRLGRNGPVVGAMGLGCMNLTGQYTIAPERASAIRTIHRALELGVTLLDTADIYGTGRPHENEILVGEAVRDRRDQAVIATKCGIVRLDGPIEERLRADPVYVKSSCYGSLERLGIDVIDVYLLHRVDPKIPIEETVGAMSELVHEGAVRYIGLSEVTPDTLRRASAVHPVALVESEWSLWSRDIEDALVPAARELGVGIVPYAPLGRGFLTGSIRSIDDLDPYDTRRTSPRFAGGNFARNLELIGHIQRVADEKSCTAAQLALAWLTAQGDDVVPIPGADRPAFVDENAAASNIEVTPEEIRRIDDVLFPGAAAGDRYRESEWVEGTSTAPAPLA